MLIPPYELEVFTSPYDPGAERYSAVAHLPADIWEALIVPLPAIGMREEGRAHG